MILHIFKLFLGRKVSFVIASVLIASASTYFYFLKNDLTKTKKQNIKNQILIDSLSKELSNISLINDKNKKEFDSYIADTNKAFALLNKEYQQRIKKESIYIKKIKEIQDVKKSDDGDVSTVLHNTFLWLQQQANKPPNKDSN